ncbi:hypothetical protein BGP77_01110 [Saccharospirillum sp. MSK14-1]|uniref:aminotransferase-like domain-containing protein n=1 Tax=Saccharospirillum sp. MSK14-1 TaxID=1897632 RepID=UPI000D49B316|nr:PLP-dependent aminotransferase family protein [Saccharospirillum sp. MSK14-1]PTY35956.1 hypothetical protein BGP77_01110 [Saccharospirillum sp. MSK14-1]
MSVLPITQLIAPTDRLDLGIGQPDPAFLSAVLFEPLQADALSLAYGAPAGDGRFRTALGGWLTEHYPVSVAPEHLLITNGSTNALDRICASFARPGDTVLVDDPTYFIARTLLADHELTLIPIPRDAEGPDPLALSALIDQHKPAFCYCIPTFQNPCGYTLSSARRQQLVDVARQSNCLLVADEVYQLLHFDTPPPPPLASFDEQAPVISIGSFSKILAPGLRLGWIQTNPELLDKLTQSAVFNSGGGLNPFTSALVQPLLEDGRLNTHLMQLRQQLKDRCQALVAALHEHLGDAISFTAPQGGYFIWVTLNSPIDSETLLPDAIAAGAGFLPGARFSAQADNRSALRLCFAFYDEERLVEAVRRLASVIR